MLKFNQIVVKNATSRGVCLWASCTLLQTQAHELSTIFPGVSYYHSLEFTSLSARRQVLCNKLFSEISEDANHKFHDFISSTSRSNYYLIFQCVYDLPFIQTNRFENTFIPSSCKYNLYINVT